MPSVRLWIALSCLVFASSPVAWAQCDLLAQGPLRQPYFRSGDLRAGPLATDGLVLAIGMPSNPTNAASFVDVYRREGGGWVFDERVSAPDGISTDQFGSAVLVVAGRLYVGAPGAHQDGVARGAVYEFTRGIGGWVHQRKLMPPAEASSGFGRLLAHHGDTLAVGFGTGAQMLTRGADESWTESAVLVVPPGIASVNLISIAIAPGVIALGDERDDAMLRDAGTVTVFERQLGDPAVWQRSALHSPAPGVSFRFGSAVTFDARGRLIVGEWGAATGLIHTFEQVGGTWTHHHAFAPPATAVNDGFGAALAWSGDLLLAAAPIFLPLDSTDPGTVYVLREVAGAWQIEATVSPSTGPRVGSRLAGAPGLALMGGNTTSVDWLAGVSDCDASGSLDACEAAAGTLVDSDCDGFPDGCPLGGPAPTCADPCAPGPDCDGNGVPDACHIAMGVVEDCNSNGTPDICETGPGPDCNRNGKPDDCDIAAGVSVDVNANGRPDECECPNSFPPKLVRFSDQSAALPAAHFGGARPHSFSGGGTVADFNRDGWQDVFVGAGGGIADQLLINNGDGTFLHQGAAWGVNADIPSQGAAAADYDGDGDIDLFVSVGRGQPCRLYRNNGDNTFSEVAAAAGVALVANALGAGWGDMDLDGDLDLAVGDWDRQSNTLYRNNGDGTFTDITMASALAPHTGTIAGFAPRFVDLNGDRWPELLFIGDFRTSRYYVNLGDGAFVERTDAAGLNLDSTEMGQTVADFDEDGDLDVYVTTIGSNNLYENRGDHRFINTGAAAGVNQSGWGWGTAAVDFDHGTRPDLVATSQSGGHFAWRNIAAPGAPMQFMDMRQCTGFVGPGSGRGLSTFDYDNDGDQDVLIFNFGRPVLLLRNDLSGPDTNWIRIFLDRGDATDIAPDGIGSVVKVRLGTRTLMGRIDGGTNYLSQSELSAHFGLAGATMIDEVIVEWTNGETTTLTDVPANQTLTVTAPETVCAPDLDANGTVDVFDLLAFLDDWFNGAADFDGSGATDVFDLLAYLDVWFEGC